MRIYESETRPSREDYREQLPPTPAPPPPPPPPPKAREPAPFPPPTVKESRQNIGPGGMILPSTPVTIENPDYLLVKGLIDKGDDKAARAYWEALTSGSNPSQLVAAKRSLGEYLAKNPDADPASKQLAREAALLQAHYDELKDPASGCITKQSLSAYAEKHKGPVADAARLFAQDGMLELIDRSGDNLITTKADGKASLDNLRNWVSTGAPKDTKSFIETYQRAQFINARALATEGSALTDDIRKQIKNGTYTLAEGASDAEKKTHAANKAAAFHELLGLSQLYQQKGEKIPDELQAAINKLGSDKEVLNHLSAANAKVKEKLGSPDSLMSKTAQASISKYVNDDLQAALAKGTGSTAATLTQWIQANAGAVGVACELGGGAAALSPELQKKVDEAFRVEVLEVNLSSPEALAKLGKTPEERQANYLKQVSAFSAVHKLTDAEVAQVKLQALGLMDPLNNADPEQMVEAWRTDGEFDEAKAEKLVEAMQKNNPGLFSSGATTADAVKALKGLDDFLRKGADVPGKAAKWNPDLIDSETKRFKPGAFSAMMSDIKDSPRTKFLTGGALHIASGILGGVGLAVGSGKPTDILTGVASFGTLMEGVSKVGGSMVEIEAQKAKWDSAAKFFKGMSAVANVVLGPISLIDGIKAVQSGDASGWLSIAGGTVGTLAAGAALADVLGMGLGFAVMDAALGAVGGVIAVVALFYLLFKSLNDQVKEDKAFRAEAYPIMQAYGLNGDPVPEAERPYNGGPDRQRPME